MKTDNACNLDRKTGKQEFDLNTISNSCLDNWYHCSDEPEPWDLTQLNIEASVMCLVSKVY